MSKHRRLSYPPMSKETEEASGCFARAANILKVSALPTVPAIDVALARSKAQAIRALAKALCEALESGAPLGSIDDKAKVLGMEVLSVQQMTLQARKRTDR